MRERTLSSTTKLARQLPKFSEVIRTKRGQIKDLGGVHRVYLEWDFNEDAKVDQVVRLITQKGKERHVAYLSVQELQHYLRAA